MSKSSRTLNENQAKAVQALYPIFQTAMENKTGTDADYAVFKEFSDKVKSFNKVQLVTFLVKAYEYYLMNYDALDWAKDCNTFTMELEKYTLYSVEYYL